MCSEVLQPRKRRRRSRAPAPRVCGTGLPPPQNACSPDRGGAARIATARRIGRDQRRTFRGRQTAAPRLRSVAALDVPVRVIWAGKTALCRSIRPSGYRGSSRSIASRVSATCAYRGAARGHPHRQGSNRLCITLLTTIVATDAAAQRSVECRQFPEMIGEQVSTPSLCSLSYPPSSCRTPT